MHILMLTNTFTPHVGGVARSVQQFTRAYREAGHQVLVVAPEFPDTPAAETDVIRVPAVQKFNGSDFSVPVPIPGFLNSALNEFQPQIIHTHHPFLLGDTAVRISANWDLPLVFTHHTQYEQYTHYVPGDSEAMKRFVLELITGFCGLCDAVIAPSETIADRLRQQGVETEIDIIPTGVEVEVIAGGDGSVVRRRSGIGPSTFVVGHVGRLAPEKGLDFLAAAVAEFLHRVPQACFLVGGTGPSEPVMRSIFTQHQVLDRVHFLGQLDRSQLADAYAAMDVFAFSSQSETQGMVLSEAMTAGVPVVAVDAPGVRELVRDGVNGRLLETEDVSTFVAALSDVWQAASDRRESLRRGALETAQQFAMPRTAERALALYERLIARGRRGPHGIDPLSTLQRRLQDEWNLLTNLAEAASKALFGESTSPP
ncbi:MAG: glycosyltransferase [Pirellulales bacterium]